MGVPQTGWGGQSWSTENGAVNDQGVEVFRSFNVSKHWNFRSL